MQTFVEAIHPLCDLSLKCTVAVVQIARWERC